MIKLARIVPLAMVLALCACQQEAKAPEQAAESGAPDAKPGLVATDGALVLPAVKGNPGVAYFTLTNQGDKPATLAGVSIDGVEKAEMHATQGGTMVPVANVEIKPGEIVKFEQGGRHVMLFGLSDKVTAGGAAEMTLTFSDGDKLSAPLMVEAMGDMAEMGDHGGMH